MMFDFLKKKEKKASNDDNKFIMSAALLIHAAKIDQNFTEKEKTIIMKTLLEIGAKEQEIENIYNEAEKIENNSNQFQEISISIDQNRD